VCGADWVGGVGSESHLNDRLRRLHRLSRLHYRPLRRSVEVSQHSRHYLLRRWPSELRLEVSKTIINGRIDKFIVNSHI